MALTYTKANRLKLSMSLEDILELATEGLDALDATAEDVQLAMDYLDGVNDVVVEDLETDGQKHLVFVIEETLARSEGEAESYAGRVYGVPVRDSDGNTPREFVAVCMDIARYRLFARRSSVPDDVVVAYEQALDWLRRLGEGTVVLNTQGSSADSTVKSRAKQGLATRTSVSFNSSVY